MKTTYVLIKKKQNDKDDKTDRLHLNLRILDINATNSRTLYFSVLKQTKTLLVHIKWPLKKPHLVLSLSFGTIFNTRFLAHFTLSVFNWSRPHFTSL